jgi:hypothetical protein
MAVLDSKLRSQLDDVCQKAREIAVAAARSALQKRAVDVAEPFSHFGPKEKELRNRLRARGRQVGDVRKSDKTQSIDQLAQELAYEFWHRMLFARFLAENHLLMHPDGVAVSLEECEELAPTADPPAPNGFVLAARYASRMLPQIFRTDDVLLEIEFAPEQRLALEKLLASPPKQAFEADDSLGWVYQFWQTAEKKRVNDSGEKIDGRTLPAVTQLFTEHYMVEFLLHNTIGAWWCARHGIQGPPGGAGIPAGKSPVEMPYLRWRDDGTPAAGKFEGWPKTLAEFTLLDPCCGSGHFNVAAFNLLVPLRMHDEGLTAQQACEAVLRDNLFGLEVDPRCTQIAAFALAVAAWKYPDAGGYRPLPSLNIACSGQGVTGKKEEWLALANGNDRLRDGMDRLYDLFQQARNLGSFIDPRQEKGDLFEAGYSELQPLLERALAKYSGNADLSAVGVAAQGIARAADILAGRYTLILTNVPYLGRGKQDDPIRDYLEDHYSTGKADLATAFVFRCLELCESGGTSALVTPQHWLYLKTYADMRRELLKGSQWNLVARLGPRAFEMIGGEVVNVILLNLSAAKPFASSTILGIDATEGKCAAEKASRLEAEPLQQLSPADQLRNPDAIIQFGATHGTALLGQFADTWQGIVTCDDNRFLGCFWEVSLSKDVWALTQQPPQATLPYTGKSMVIRWERDKGSLRFDSKAHNFPPGAALARPGVAVQRMNEMNVSLMNGEIFGDHVAPLIAKDVAYLPAIWCFAISGELRQQVRNIDTQLKVAVGSLLKVPFDLAHWRAVADEKYPKGLPQPHSDDPRQWLFEGDIASSTDPLQVAVARLLGFRWPQQPKNEDAIDKLADSDGILCLPSVRGEAAAAERLLEVLRAAYGKKWSESVLHNRLTDAGCKAGTTLDDWLRNQFFEQHCRLFHNRPFIWHIWDGRRDGFSVLVNYHKLNHEALENLTHSYLRDWITAQTKSDKAGADLRLGAAQELQAKLKLILAGEPPYDIFVRWKPLHEQAIGWHPDLNDGVRMNIRPFVEADILRKAPNIKWTKDRGKEPERDKDDYPWFWNGKTFTGDRVNDVHLTNAVKQAPRTK